jgi:hypothetical protein
VLKTILPACFGKLAEICGVTLDKVDCKLRLAGLAAGVVELCLTPVQPGDLCTLACKGDAAFAPPQPSSKIRDRRTSPSSLSSSLFGAQGP